MQALTLEQLRAANQSGGIASVTLKAQGGAFVLTVATRRGGHGLLVTARRKQARRFADLRKAMLLLRELGIATARIDTTDWNPGDAAAGTPRPDRAIAMKRTHAAAAHDRWFRAEVAKGLREADDPSSTMVPHDRAMADMKAAIDHIARRSKKSRRRAR